MTFPTHQLARLHNPQLSPIHALTFSSGTGQYILTGSSDRQIRLWNPLNKRLIQTYSAHGYEVLDIAVDSSNEKFVSGGGDKSVFLWDVATAQTVRRFNGHAGKINSVAFGGEGEGGSVVLSGSFDGTVKIWDLKSRGSDHKAIMTLGEARDSVTSVQVWGHEVFVGSVDGRVRVYDLAMGCLETDCVAPGKGVTSLSVAKGGEAYLCSGLDSTLRFMDRKTGKCLQSFRHEGFRNETYRLRSMLAGAEAFAVSGTEDGRVLAWDVLSGELVHEVWHKEGGGSDGVGQASKKDVVSAVAWNQLRKIWASAGGDGTVVVWGKPE